MALEISWYLSKIMTKPNLAIKKKKKFFDLPVTGYSLRHSQDYIREDMCNNSHFNKLKWLELTSFVEFWLTTDKMSRLNTFLYPTPCQAEIVLVNILQWAERDSKSEFVELTHCVDKWNIMNELRQISVHGVCKIRRHSLRAMRYFFVLLNPKEGRLTYSKTK